METKDIRWIQRFENYQKALSQLVAAVELSRQRALTPLEQQGLIQAFEYTHELAWKSLKDFLQARGTSELFGSRDVTRSAFGLGLIEHGDIWMQMIQSRNQTTHTYNEATVAQISAAIIDSYLTEFVGLRSKLAQLQADEASV